MSAQIRRNAPVSLDFNSLHSVIDKIDDHATKIHTAARWYAKHGFKIIPFTTHGYPKGLSQHHATAKLTLIDEWWHPTTGKCPGAAIAMAHGGEAGFCAIDLDVKADINGLETLTDLIYAYGDYNDSEASSIDTLMASTPSGGRHLVFRYHPEIISNASMSYPGIDTRGGLKRNPVQNGGITFVEPSYKPGTTNGNTYRWDDKGTGSIIDMPQWLVDTLNGRPPKKAGLQLQDSYNQSATGEHGEGRDRNIYMDLLRFVGIGYNEQQIRGLEPDILARMDPPDQLMVRRKIESVLASDAFAKQQSDGDRKEKSDSLDLDRSDKNQILRTTKNLETVLRSAVFEHGFGMIEFDEFHNHFVRNKKPLAMVTDYSVDIVMWLSREMTMEYGKDMVRGTIEAIAFQRPHCNAARDYMLACPASTEHYDDDYWGSARKGPGPVFDRLCAEVLDLDNKDLHEGYNEGTKKIYKAQLWFWLQGVCARACVPGCKMEMVLNIFGTQGIGKSTFFRDLCPDSEWFTDSIKDAVVESSDNKDELSKLHGSIIAEMPELSPIKNRKGKSSDDKFKQFISTQVDRFRAPFGKDTVNYKRTCALAGTSNNRDIYRDMTGDRRFLSLDHGNTPIKLGDKDSGVMEEIRDAMWGEIVSSFKPGELTLHYNKLLVCVPLELRPHQNAINNLHRYEEIGVFEITEWAETRSRFTYAEIIEFANTVPGLDDNKVSNQQVMRLARGIFATKGNYTLRRGGIRHDAAGNKNKTSFWVNNNHPTEIDLLPGDKAPPHWSRFDEHKPEEIPEAEY